MPGLPLFAVTVWGAHPALSPDGGPVPAYTVLGHRHAHLELGEQTLPDVTHVSGAEIREFEVCEGQTHSELSIDVKAENSRRPQAIHLEEAGALLRQCEGASVGEGVCA